MTAHPPSELRDAARLGIVIAVGSVAFVALMGALAWWAA